ncbi:MAG: hypothetical protein ACI4XL_03840 [Bacillus sp. (in: firmicutes)]
MMLNIMLALFTLLYGADAEPVSLPAFEQTKYQDVTGDKKKEKIQLSGIFSEDNRYYLSELKVTVSEGSLKEETQFKVEDGTKPEVSFMDIDRDGIKDIFLTIEPVEQGNGLRAYSLQIKDGKLMDLSVPEPLPSVSNFVNGYKAEINIGQESFKVDLKGRKEQYDALGLYHEGQLNEPIELIIGPFESLRPIYMLQGKALQGTQKVSGAFMDDQIGEIRSVWQYKDDQWVLKKLDFQKR